MLYLEEVVQAILGIYIFIYLFKTIPGQVWTVPESYMQKDEAFRFQDNRHMMVVRLSSLATGSLYTPAIILRTHFS
jgi:hypothetical protein